VGVGLDAGVDSEADARGSAEGPGAGLDPGDLGDALELERRDPAVAGADGEVDLGGPLGDAAVEDALGGTPALSTSASSPPETTSAPQPAAAMARMTGPAELAFTA